MAAGGDTPLAGHRALPPPPDAEIARVDVTPEMVRQIGAPGSCRICTGVERTVDPNAVYVMFRDGLIDFQTYREAVKL